MCVGVCALRARRPAPASGGWHHADGGNRGLLAPGPSPPRPALRTAPTPPLGETAVSVPAGPPASPRRPNPGGSVAPCLAAPGGGGRRSIRHSLGPQRRCPSQRCGAPRCLAGSSGRSAAAFGTGVRPRSCRVRALDLRTLIRGIRGKPARDPAGEERRRLQPGRHVCVAPAAATFSAESRSPASKSFCSANNGSPKVAERGIARCRHLNFPPARPPPPLPPPARRPRESGGSLV